jgi:RNA polymerase sigma-70 factor (ECF subfamily)
VRIVQERRRRDRWLRFFPDRRRGRDEDAAGGADDLARVPADQPTALEALERREATATMYAILDGVAEKYRTVLILFELEGLSGQEIAAITGTSLSNVWVRLFRGREKVLERYRAWEAKENR